MNNTLTTSFLLLFSAISCFSQNLLISRCTDGGITFTPNSKFNLINENVHHCNETIECPIYGLFGTPDAIWESADGQCEVSVTICNKEECVGSTYKVYENDIFSQYVYNNIQMHLGWGNAMIGQLVPPTKKDFKYLKMFLTRYPNKLARKYFNADEMYIYPINIRKKCRKKFCHALVVIPIRHGNGIPPFLHFVMTENGRGKFNVYLKDFGKTIMYKKNR